MKKSKIIIPALAMLVMSTAATVTGTVAWFSMNKTVTAEGMMVRANGSGSIIISDYAAGFPTASTKTTAVDFKDTAVDSDGMSVNKLYPSTHVNSGSGLKYVTNGAEVCYETGTQRGATALTFDTVTESSNNAYYKDYNLYIAGDGREFQHQDIEISLAWAGTGTLADINKAISVDFYYQNKTSAGIADQVFANDSTNSFAGTLNLAGRDPEANDESAKTKVVISDITLGASGTAALAITMRVYFDGALVQTAGSNAGTAYTDCGANETVGTYSSNTDVKFFYNANREIVYENTTANASKSVSGLSIVDYSASTITYAKSLEYGDIANVSLKVSFDAKDHVNP